MWRWGPNLERQLLYFNTIRWLTSGGSPMGTHQAWKQFLWLIPSGSIFMNFSVQFVLQCCLDEKTPCLMCVSLCDLACAALREDGVGACFLQEDSQCLPLQRCNWWPPCSRQSDEHWSWASITVFCGFANMDTLAACFNYLRLILIITCVQKMWLIVTELCSRNPFLKYRKINHMVQGEHCSLL